MVLSCSNYSLLYVTIMSCSLIMLLYIVFSILQGFERVSCSDDGCLRPGEIPWLHFGVILLKVLLRLLFNWVMYESKFCMDQNL